ncbi:hypothetical protein MSPP1_001453 [Malassezia sp. CBS 17886]|nr:hypothetical protein MSPP1_001453 [Malassezia sp. CBS 17886]
MSWDASVARGGSMQSAHASTAVPPARAALDTVRSPAHESTVHAGRAATEPSGSTIGLPDPSRHLLVVRRPGRVIEDEPDQDWDMDESSEEEDRTIGESESGSEDEWRTEHDALHALYRYEGEMKKAVRQALPLGDWEARENGATLLRMDGDPGGETTPVQRHVDEEAAVSAEDATANDKGVVANQSTASRPVPAVAAPAAGDAPAGALVPFVRYASEQLRELQSECKSPTPHPGGTEPERALPEDVEMRAQKADADQHTGLASLEAYLSSMMPSATTSDDAGRLSRSMSYYGAARGDGPAAEAGPAQTMPGGFCDLSEEGISATRREVSDGEAQENSAGASSDLLSVTDLDVVVANLDDPSMQYEWATMLGEFLGPASSRAVTEDEVQKLPVGRVEEDGARAGGARLDGAGQRRQKLSVAGVPVGTCGVCLCPFRQGEMACLFPCFHVYVMALRTC